MLFHGQLVIRTVQKRTNKHCDTPGPATGDHHSRMCHLVCAAAHTIGHDHRRTPRGQRLAAARLFVAVVTAAVAAVAVPVGTRKRMQILNFLL